MIKEGKKKDRKWTYSVIVFFTFISSEDSSTHLTPAITKFTSGDTVYILLQQWDFYVLGGLATV